MMLRIVVLICSIFLLQINATRRRCINTGVLFPDKILRSPIVVYGESTAKRVYLDSATELLFNVTFRVDCIFKGQTIESQIEVTDAGIKAGHTACQWLDPGHSYILFLEQWGTNINSYRPLDFQELVADDMTYELLTKTCYLTRVIPLHSTTNNCPNVSMTQFCPHDKIDVSIMPKPAYSNDINTQVKSSYFDHGSLFQLQSNVTVPKDGSVMTQNRDLRKNDACPATISGILMMIVAVGMSTIY